jgi:putative transposase
MNLTPTYNPNIHHRRSIRLKGYDYSQAGLYFITICCHNRICRFGAVVDGKMILNDAGIIADSCWLEIPKHFPNAVLHEYIIMPNHVHGIIELTDSTMDVQTVGVGNNTVRVGNNTVGVENNTVGVENNTVGVENNNVGVENNNVGVENNNVGVENFQPLQNKFQKMIPRSIGSIVKGYKIGVTKRLRTVGVENNTVGVENNNVRVENNNVRVENNNVRVENNNVRVENFQPLQPDRHQPQPDRHEPVQQIWQRNYYEHIIRNEQSYLRIAEYIINNPTQWKEDSYYIV